jgi:chloramphenicol-sensitive protein RarD
LAAAAARTRLTGLLYGLLAYGIWGLFPLYWPLLEPADAVEIVAHRSVWSLVFLAIVVTLVRAWPQVRRTFATPRTRWLLLAAAALVSINWTGYIWAVNSGHVVEASLGYFINPLVSVLIGVVALGERLRRAQWVAVILGGVAVAVLTFAYGRPPWIALLLASSFALYGLAKKLADVPAVPSLTVETIFMAPVALAVLGIWHLQGWGHFGSDPLQTALFVGAGVVTALPLLAFGAAAIRIPLSSLGLLQYLTPILQFLLGVLVFDEVLSPVGWFGFVLIWWALLVFSTDALRSARASSS